MTTRRSSDGSSGAGGGSGSGAARRAPRASGSGSKAPRFRRRCVAPRERLLPSASYCVLNYAPARLGRLLSAETAAAVGAA